MFYRKGLFIISTIIAGIFAYFVFTYEQHSVKESVIYFPLDEDTSFKDAATLVTLLGKNGDDEYTVNWKIYSDVGKEVYLREDIGFLFADGKLLDKASKWEEGSQKLFQSNKVAEEDSSHFKAISFHHAEIHYENEVIKSSQKMSSDHLYVIDSPKQQLESFKEATTKNEKEWKNILDHATTQQLKYSWSKLLNYYGIPKNKYTAIPLTQLPSYNDKRLPGMTMDESKKAVGRLWEGLYKNYFLGLKKQDGTTVSPIGSTVPLILISDNHLVVLIESRNGEFFQLIQHLE
jgi:hypothetical protein